MEGGEKMLHVVAFLVGFARNWRIALGELELMVNGT